MSMVVSYKKQVVLGILLLIILLVVIELFVNIWLYNFYRCEFEDSKMFKDADPELNRKICIQSMGLDFTKQSIKKIPGTSPMKVVDGIVSYNTDVIYINNYGFRGPDIEKVKPENTFRIFVLGGSTTFGSGVLDEHTYPSYLQKLFDAANLPFKVEVINVGWSAFTSVDETKKIKTELLNFAPDLFLVFDGHNEMKKYVTSKKEVYSPTLWKERWIEICNLGDEFSFQTLVTLQPVLGFGERVLTEHEYENYVKKKHFRYQEEYPNYLIQLEELQNHCSLTADLTSLFDNIQDPIYFDYIHTGPQGNQIIAEKFFELSLPLVLENSQNIANNESGARSSIDEIHNKLKENDSEFSKETIILFKSIISSYKTPKVFSIIFE